MTATTIRVQMAQRKDTAANWTAANPILLSGEIGYETDTKKFKIGDGTTNWNSLAYLPIPDGSGNLTITGNLEIGTTGSLTFEGSTANGFETTLAVTDPTADRTITLPNVSGTIITTGDTGSVTSTMLADGTIVNADISGSAEIAVSKLANGTANQVIVTDGTNVSWSDNLTLAGDLTVNGTTTTINTQDLLVQDKNIIIGNVTSPTDVTADGGGITLKGATDKTINWVDATDAWTSSERFSYPLGSATAPALTFTGDPNTGIYSPGADQVAISTNGTGRLFVDAIGDVGIGNSSPNTILDVTQPVDITAGSVTGADRGTILLTNSGTLTQSVGALGTGIAFTGTSSTSRRRALIATYQSDADPDRTGLKFFVYPSTATAQDTVTEVLSINHLGTVTLTATSASTSFIANIGASEAARIDSSGRLLVGTSTSVSQFGVQPQIQSTGTSGAGAYLGLTVFNTAANSASNLVLGHSKGESVGTYTASVANDLLGEVTFTAANGTDMRRGASIGALADADWGTNDHPARLVFSTTADGASSPTEALRITNDRVIARNQGAPAAVNATATLTVANLKTGIITSTSALATDMTLPTGTDTQAGFSGTYDNFTFEWSVINTGPSLVRVLAGTAHTIVGSGSVATGTSGRFASRRTAANTFVTYRLS